MEVDVVPKGEDEVVGPIHTNMKSFKCGIASRMAISATENGGVDASPTAARSEDIAEHEKCWRRVSDEQEKPWSQRCTDGYVHRPLR
eukprot:15899076-Heterocapsa_arctica.AAC.1